MANAIFVTSPPPLTLNFHAVFSYLFPSRFYRLKYISEMEARNCGIAPIEPVYYRYLFFEPIPTFLRSVKFLTGCYLRPDVHTIAKR